MEPSSSSSSSLSPACVAASFILGSTFLKFIIQMKKPTRTNANTVQVSVIHQLPTAKLVDWSALPWPRARPKALMRTKIWRGLSSHFTSLLTDCKAFLISWWWIIECASVSPTWQLLTLSNIPSKNINAFMRSTLSLFVPMSAGLVVPETGLTTNEPSAIRSCSHKLLQDKWGTLPTPRRLIIPLAAAESKYRWFWKNASNIHLRMPTINTESQAPEAAAYISLSAELRLTIFWVRLEECSKHPP